MKEGYIKLHRQLQDHWLWDDKPYSKGQAWIDLLLTANHKDFKTIRKGKVVERRKGEVNTSSRYLADKWGWSRNKVDRFLRALEGDGMITTDGATDGTTITIENWDFWQDSQATDGATYEATDEATDGANDGANDKNDKNDKNYISNTKSTGTTEQIPYQEIVNMYRQTCTSYPTLRGISEKRKKAIAARYREHGKNIDAFREVFTKAENSSFLKGRNDRGWRADFDWLMKPSNFDKVLEDRYADRDIVSKGGNHNGSSNYSNSSDSAGDSPLFRKRTFDFSAC